MKLFFLSFCMALMFFVNTVGDIAIADEIQYPIFLGTIESIEKEDGNKGYKVVVDGYIKGGVIKKEKIVAIVSEDTEIKMLGDENLQKSFSKGDNVFIEFSMGMTFSIPPQSFARKMEVSRKPTYIKMSLFE
ncbi:MAG: hypothetical protein ACRC57_09820 [Sarcina sp.]